MIAIRFFFYLLKITRLIDNSAKKVMRCVFVCLLLKFQWNIFDYEMGVKLMKLRKSSRFRPFSVAYRVFFSPFDMTKFKHNSHASTYLSIKYSILYAREKYTLFLDWDNRNEQNFKLKFWPKYQRSSAAGFTSLTKNYNWKCESIFPKIVKKNDLSMN